MNTQSTTLQSKRKYWRVIFSSLSIITLSILFISCGDNPSAVDPDSVNDSIPPVCKIISPLDKDTVRNMVTVRTLCSDNKRVAKAELLVNGAVVSTIDKSPWDFQWNTDKNMDGMYILQVRATDAAGNKTTSTEVHVRLQTPFTLYLVNTTYTTMSITAQGQSMKSIKRGDTATFIYAANPGTISFTATTSGTTSQGTQVGLLLDWSKSIDVSATKSYLSRLVVSADYFMLYLKNTGISSFGNLVVNEGLQNETKDNILIAPNGVQYTIGYYKAFSNTVIRMDNLDGSGRYIFWKHNTHFTFPNTDNQNIVLLNTIYGIKQDIGLEQKIMPNISTEDGLNEKVYPR